MLHCRASHSQHQHTRLNSSTWSLPHQQKTNVSCFIAWRGVPGVHNNLLLGSLMRGGSYLAGVSLFRKECFFSFQPFSFSVYEPRLRGSFLTEKKITMLPSFLHESFAQAASIPSPHTAWGIADDGSGFSPFRQRLTNAVLLVEYGVCFFARLVVGNVSCRFLHYIPHTAVLIVFLLNELLWLTCRTRFVRRVRPRRGR